MSGENWTPGPWNVLQFDGEDWPEKRISISANRTVGISEAVLISPRYAPSNIHDNARLAAAAPELYEALADITSSLDMDSICRKLEKGRQALAKARGEET